MIFSKSDEEIGGEDEPNVAIEDRAKARELYLLNRKVSASEAYGMGLVAEVLKAATPGLKPRQLLPLMEERLARRGGGSVGSGGVEGATKLDTCQQRAAVRRLPASPALASVRVIVQLPAPMAA